MLLALVASLAISADRVPESPAVERLHAAEQSLSLARRLGVSGSEGQTLLQGARDDLIRALELAPGLARAGVVLGDVLLELGDHALADRLLTAALAASPNDLQLSHRLGIHRFRLGQPSRGVALLEAAANADPSLFDATYLLAGYYYRLKEDDKALRWARAYLKVRPRDAGVVGLVGNIHLRAGRTEEAVRAFDEVLKLDPNNLPVRVNLGNVLFQLKDYERAVELYQAVLGADPDLVEVQYNLASAYFALERYAEASDAFGAYLTHMPADPRGQYFGGLSAARSGDGQAAVERLRRATELAPDDPWAPHALADFLRQQHELSVAEQYVAIALQRKSDSAVIQRLGGVIAREQGALGLAVRRLEAAQQLDPRSAAIRAELGLARALGGDDDGGISDLEAAQVLDPKELRVKRWLPVARTRRAVQLARAGRDAESDADLRRALEVDPGFVDAWWNLAWAADARGDGAAAERALRTALAQRPTDPDLYLALAYVAARAGRWDQAARALGSAEGAHDPGLRWLVQGALHAGFGEWDAALQAFATAADEGLDTTRATAEVQLDKATALFTQSRAQDALALLGSLSGLLSPEQARARAGLEVLCRLTLGVGLERVDGLLSSLEAGVPEGRGLRRLVDDADLFRGYAQYRLGNTAGARERLERFVSVRPDDARARRVLVAALLDDAEEAYAERRLDVARTRVQRAAQLAPDDARVRHAGACLDYAAGKREEAARVFEDLELTNSPPEAVLNLGLYLADVRHDPAGAAARFRAYLDSRGTAQSVAKRRLEQHERVFGP